MKRYSEYKDSDIEWIGEIPQGWGITKIGRFYKCQLGKMLQPNPAESTDVLMPYLCAANIKKDGISNEPKKEMWFSESDKNIFSVEPGDLLIVEGGDVGLSVLYTDEKTTYIQNALHRVRHTSNASNRFLNYWMKYLKTKGYIDLVCNKATIAHFTKNKLINTPLLLPSPSEQLDVTVYLDHKTAAIDELIADKQKLVTLLQEKRTAVISEAVTKGLDKTAKMKDSGVNWIWQIPDSWKVSRIGFETWVRARLGWKGLKAEEYVDSGYAFLSTPNIKNTLIDFENINYISKERYDESPEIKLNIGDVLLAKDGSTLGTVNVVRTLPKETTVNSSIAVITPSSRINSVYLYYLFQSDYLKSIIQMKKGGMGVPHLFQGDIVKFSIPLPPLDEQQSIAFYLDQKTAQIGSLISDINEQIEKLKEYRQAVISEAVTGKVAV